MMLKQFCKSQSDYFNYFWAGVLLLLPFYFEVNNIDSRIYKDLLFLKLSILSLVVFPNKPSKISYAVIPCLIIGALTYQSYRPSPIFQSVHLGLGLAILNQFIANWNKNTSRIILNAMAVSCIIQAGYFVSNGLGYDVYELITGMKRAIKDPGQQNLGHFPIIGSLDHWMLSGCHLVATLPALFRGKWKLFIPFVLCSLVVVDSSLTVVTLIGTGCVWIIMRKKSLILPISAVGLLTLWGVKDLPFFTTGTRLEAWANSFKLTTDPIFGMGFGYFHDLYQRFYPLGEKFIHPHNEFINIYVTLGLWGVGTSLYLSVLLWKNWKAETHFFYSFVAIMINAVGGFPFHISSLALIFIVSIASFFKEGHNNFNN